MSENATVMSVEEKMKKASTTLATMLDYLGLDATVKAEDRNGRIALIAVSEDAGRIIGRKGQTLDHLQLLLNRMVLRNDTESPRITIDVDGYSKKPARGDRRRKEDGPREGGEEIREASHEEDRGGRDSREGRESRDGGREREGGRGGRRDGGRRDGGRRDGGRRGFGDRDGRSDFKHEPAAPQETEAEHEQKIRQQALDAVKEVKRWGDPVTLPPMNSHDRRIVHITLKDDTDIKSESSETDDGVSHKSVIVSLNKQIGRASCRERV